MLLCAMGQAFIPFVGMKQWDQLMDKKYKGKTMSTVFQFLTRLLCTVQTFFKVIDLFQKC